MQKSGLAFWYTLFLLAPVISVYIIWLSEPAAQNPAARITLSFAVILAL